MNEDHSAPHDLMLLLEINLVEEQRWIGEHPAGQKPGDGLDVGFNCNSDAWPNESRPINIYESLEVVEKMPKEEVEISKRLAPM